MRGNRRIFSMIILVPLLGLAGCEQAFRYPCQNPENWDRPECKRPVCEVNRDCPDLIFKDNTNIKPLIGAPVAPPVPPSKGDCK